ncbi:MAG: oligosaccharide flippase family protein [Verrucomicrobiota bacterium]|nr:oligosaccharide flippase family protein [Verrucomicrobiota bacterium]
MTSEQVKQNIYRNSISNYIFLVLRLGLGVVVFRLIYQSLTPEEFGFWAVLWSVFGYGILLDFGFGFTAQKRVAELSVHQDWPQLSKILSTIFFTYVGIATLMVLTGLVGAPYIIDFFRITPENRERFENVLMVFLCGMGLAFPLGIFPEILRGQQRISLANYILISGYIVSFVLVCLCVKLGWGLIALLIITLSCSIASEIVCGICAMRFMPEVRLSPTLFSKEMVSGTMRFSVYAYITTLTTIILTRTDQLVISTALAVSAVAIYQAGAKIAEMFTSFALQIPDTLSPVAAHLHAKGDKEFLRNLLVSGTRFSVMLATPLYLICAFYMDGALWILTGDKNIHSEAFWVGQVLLFWGYMTILTQSVSKRIFMMCGHEKRLMWLGVGEAVLNLGLSLGLIFIFRNVLCVAIGSLVATFFFGWFYLWPWAAREANMSGMLLARKVLLPTWGASLPLLALIAIERNITQLDFHENLVLFLVECSLACAVAAFGMWKLGLNEGERIRFAAQFGKLFSRSTAA